MTANKHDSFSCTLPGLQLMTEEEKTTERLEEQKRQLAQFKLEQAILFPKVVEEPKVEPVVVEEKPSKEPFWWQLICIFILFPFVVVPFFCVCWVISLLLRTGALFVGISVGGSIFNGGKK